MSFLTIGTFCLGYNRYCLKNQENSNLKSNLNSSIYLKDTSSTKRRLKEVGPTIRIDLNGNDCQLKKYTINNDNVRGASMVLDNQIPVVAYQNTLETYLIKCFNLICSSKSVNFIDSSFFLLFPLNIDIKLFLGNPVIAYGITLNIFDQFLKLALCNDPICSIPTIVDLEFGLFPSLKILPDGRPVISYTRVLSPNQGIYLIICDDQLCTSYDQKIIALGNSNIDSSSSLELMNNTIPVISYLSVNNSLYFIQFVMIQIVIRRKI